MSMLRLMLPAAIVAAGFTGFAAFQGVDPSTLPDDEGKALVTRACGDCHGLGTVMARRLPPAEWKDVVDDMVSRGAEADEADVKKITLYFTQHAGRADVNSASEDDLKAVLGLSGDEAASLVKARSGGAAFKTIDDVKKVPGIDAKKLDEHKDAIAFSAQ